MTLNDVESRMARSGDFQPCNTAASDAETPGSDPKEKFPIIGGGISENPDRSGHISIPHGFNVGPAGQPPNRRWRFIWGRWGTAGEVALEEGNIINISTGIFRGCENICTDYSTTMAVLDSDCAGGGVIEAPQVIEDAKDRKPLLGCNGKLYDNNKGQSLPESMKPMPLASPKPVLVMDDGGLTREKSGFEEGVLMHAFATKEKYRHDRRSVLMPLKGHMKLIWEDDNDALGGELTLDPGDTASASAGLDYTFCSLLTGEASLSHIFATDDPAGAIWFG